jgi:sensor histidine kinase YesM
VDPPRARGMLEAFVQYLRASFGTMRGDTHPAGSELDMVDAYLRLLQTRMDDRLRFAIDADADARAVPLPPLLLQPLVENAVVHGLEPKVDGGEVRIRARVDGQTLVMEVRDDGLGLDAPKRRAGRAGAGAALQNIRERLAARYGDEASLSLQALPQGTCATLRLPLSTA